MVEEFVTVLMRMQNSAGNVIDVAASIALLMPSSDFTGHISGRID